MACFSESSCRASADRSTPSDPRPEGFLRNENRRLRGRLSLAQLRGLVAGVFRGGERQPPRSGTVNCPFGNRHDLRFRHNFLRCERTHRWRLLSNWCADFVGRPARRRRRALGLGGRIDPAGVHPAVEGVVALGSMFPCRTTQRNAIWMWPAGHPNRSYRSRWRKAVSKSSRHSRLTTRRPSQRHSGLAAGPPKSFSASANSSAFFAASFASAAGGFSVAFGSMFCADVGPATHGIATLKAAARRRRLGPYMVALNYEALPADWPPIRALSVSIAARTAASETRRLKQQRDATPRRQRVRRNTIMIPRDGRLVGEKPPADREPSMNEITTVGLR